MERLTSKLRKLQQAKTRKREPIKNVKPVATDSNCSKQSDVNKLAVELKAKLNKVDKLLVNLRAQANNKEVKSYMCAFSASSETRSNGQTNPNKTLKNRKRKQRKREKDKKRFQEATESRKQHIKNLSDKQFTDEQIALLSRGLKFIPTPVTNEDFIRHNLLKDFNLFARRMRLQHIFHGKENKQHPFYVKSTWEPPVQQSVALETFLEEVKFELANIPIKRPKDNLSPGERRALKNLLHDKTIIVKKADKEPQP